MDSPKWSDLMYIAHTLSAANFISVQDGLPEITKKMRMNFQEADLRIAFKSDEFFSKLVQVTMQ